MAPDPLAEAKHAREHTRSKFLDAVQQGAEVRRVTHNLNEHVRRNGFGEGLEKIWQMPRRRNP